MSSTYEVRTAEGATQEDDQGDDLRDVESEGGNAEDFEDHGVAGVDSSEDAAAAAAANRRSRIKKILLALLLVGFIVFVIVDSTTNGYIQEGIQAFLRWIEENPIPGFFAFAGVYFVATIFFIPGLILTLGSGFVFSNAFGLGLGVLVATISVFVGASLGAIAAFLLGRYILRDWVRNLTQKYPIFQAIDKALEDKGLRIMVLLRLSPVIPFNVLNYISGITAVHFRHYVWALIAILPGSVLYVFLGASARSLSSIGSSTDSAAITKTTIVVGVVLGVIAIALSSRYAKKELNKILAQEEPAAEEETAGGSPSVAVNEEDEFTDEENHPRGDRELEVSASTGTLRATHVVPM